MIKNNINEKSYIGFTTNFNSRLSYHMGAYNPQQYALHRAILKYGWENFSVEIIYESCDIQHCKNKMEPYFITKFNTLKCGYNSTTGGDGIVGYRHSEKTKKLISYYSKNISNETRKKLRRPKRKRSLEHCKKISKNKSKYWYVIDPKGNKIKIFNLKEFSLSKNLCYSSMLKVSWGQRKSHKGYRCFKCL